MRRITSSAAIDAGLLGAVTVLPLAGLRWLAAVHTGDSMFAALPFVLALGVAAAFAVVLGPWFLARCLGASPAGCALALFVTLLGTWWVLEGQAGWVFLGFVPCVVTLIGLADAERMTFGGFGAFVGASAIACLATAVGGAIVPTLELCLGLCAWAGLPVFGELTASMRPLPPSARATRESPPAPPPLPPPLRPPVNPTTAPVAAGAPAGTSAALHLPEPTRPRKPVRDERGMTRSELRWILAMVGVAIIVCVVVAWAALQPERELSMSYAGPLCLTTSSHRMPDDRFVCTETMYADRYGKEDAAYVPRDALETFIGPLDVRYRVVAAGPAYITVSLDEIHDAVFGDELRLVERATFIVDAPVGAIVFVSGDGLKGVSRLRLQIDIDGDGSVDEQRKPTVVASGSRLAAGRDAIDTSFEHPSPDRLSVSVRSRASGAVPEAPVFAWVFPAVPVASRYTGPLDVAADAYVVIAIVHRNGEVSVREAPDAPGLLDVRRMSVAVNATTRMTFDTPGRISELIFAGQPGQRIAVDTTSSTLGPLPCCSAGVEIFDAAGEVLSPPFRIGVRDATLPEVVLPDFGQYRLRINPHLATTGAVDVTISELGAVTREIVLDGVPVSANPSPGRAVVLRFDGRAGTEGVVVLRAAADALCCHVALTVISPAGAELASLTREPVDALAPVGVALPFAMASDGPYSVVIAATGDAAAAFTASVRSVTQRAFTPALDGEPAALTFDTPGQMAMGTFTAAAGQQVHVEARDLLPAADARLTQPWSRVQVRVEPVGEGGDALAVIWLTPGALGSLQVSVPTAGTYRIVVTPPGDLTGNVDVALRSTPSGNAPLHAAAWDEATTALPLAAAPTTAQYWLPAHAGQVLVLDAASTAGHCCLAQARLLGPDGKELGVFDLPGEPHAARARLRLAGLYVLEISASQATTIDLSISLIDDVYLQAIVDGPPLMVQTLEPLQEAWVTFNAHAGPLWIAADMPPLTRPTDGAATYRIVEDALVVDPVFSPLVPGGHVLERQRLRENGTLTLHFVSTQAGTFTVALSLASSPVAPPEPTPLPTPPVPVRPAALTVGGPPLDVTVPGAEPDRSTALTFEGVAGQHLRIAAELLAPEGGASTPGPTPCCGFALSVQPLGASNDLGRVRWQEGAAALEITLPADGSYVIWLSPLGNSAGTLRVTLAAVP